MRASGSGSARALARYLRDPVQWIDVTVVDGSDGPVLDHHARLFPPAVRLLRPDARLVRTVCAVGGVGIRADHVVVARVPCSSRHVLRRGGRRAFGPTAACSPRAA